MIRQNMELRHPCETRNCRKCRERRTDGWRERLAATLAAWGFWLGGMIVILADGGLLTAVAAGTTVGAAALALTLWITGRVRENAPACGI